MDSNEESATYRDVLEALALGMETDQKLGLVLSPLFAISTDRNVGLLGLRLVVDLIDHVGLQVITRRVGVGAFEHAASLCRSDGWLVVQVLAKPNGVNHGRRERQILLGVSRAILLGIRNQDIQARGEACSSSIRHFLIDALSEGLDERRTQRHVSHNGQRRTILIET